MSSSLRGLFALIFMAMMVPSAHAKVCGDSVAGKRVPCDCGDIVVSDTQLRIDDPIAMHRCESNGLIVRADASAESITLNLAGLPIVGSGVGTGLRIVRGGRNGATILGGSDGAVGQVVSFATGISARGRGKLAVLSDMSVESNLQAALVVDSDSAVLTNVSTLREGKKGLTGSSEEASQ